MSRQQHEPIPPGTASAPRCRAEPSSQMTEEIAEVFGITPGYVDKLLKLRREGGDLTP